MFQWDSTRERFLASLQREREEARVAAITQLHHEEKVVYAYVTACSKMYGADVVLYGVETL